MYNFYDKISDANVGDLIEIVEILGDPTQKYRGRRGIISSIDNLGRLHGTWGDVVLDNLDVIKVLVRKGNEMLEPDREPPRTPRPGGPKPKIKKEDK